MSLLQSSGAAGGRVTLIREDGQAESFELVLGGPVIRSVAVTLSYHEATSGQLTRLAGVAVAGIAEGDLAWCSPSGPTDTLGVLGAVGACYVVGPGSVDIIGQLFSLDPIPSTVNQPATVFWIRPDGT